MLNGAIDMAGQRHGRLLVTRRAGSIGKLAAWHCLCDCGREAVVCGAKMRSGNTLSCGCLHNDTLVARTTKHGAAKSAACPNGSREYRSWCAAKTRCYNQKFASYPNYGGRGITICDRWRFNFADFLSDMGLCPHGHSLDRIDNNGPYAPGNCRWATGVTQANNTRANHFVEHGNERHTVAEWERIKGWKEGVLKRRLLSGWPVERALTEPVRHY